MTSILNTAIYIHQETTDMAQNNNIVVYALMVAGGAQQAPPPGQTYHLPPFALVGEFSHRRPDGRNIKDYKLTIGVPHHPKNKPPPNTFVGGML